MANYYFQYFAANSTNGVRYCNSTGNFTNVGAPGVELTSEMIRAMYSNNY